MRKIVVGAFVSLDGVMQAPGGPQEDPTGGFKYGGWVTPHWDHAIGAAMGETFLAPFDLLLGRRTYDIFAAHWPFVQLDPKASDFNELNMQIARRFNAITKYVATHRPETLTWQNSRPLGTDVVATLRELKQQDGPMLLTQGSGELIQTLLAHDLVDKLLTAPPSLVRADLEKSLRRQTFEERLDEGVQQVRLRDDGRVRRRRQNGEARGRQWLAHVAHAAAA
jgi:dihydrofolate reductase